jgi:hypothetical protein
MEEGYGPIGYLRERLAKYESIIEKLRPALAAEIVMGEYLLMRENVSVAAFVGTAFVISLIAIDNCYRKKKSLGIRLKELESRPRSSSTIDNIQ